MINIKRYLKIICIIIGFLILLIFIMNFYLKTNFSNKILYFKDYAILIEKSDKLEPQIQKNEFVVIKRQEKYDLDDIVAYMNYNNNLIIRKIVQIDEYSFLSKAEKTNFTEPNEKIEKIEGKVIYHSKILGKIFNW